MEANITIPEQNEQPKVIDFHFRVGDKFANVTVEYMDRRDTVKVPFQDVIDGSTAAQRQIIKIWYKRIGVAAINSLIIPDGAIMIDESSVTGDLFEDS